jgi:hypothetical protein
LGIGYAHLVGEIVKPFNNDPVGNDNEYSG